MATDLTPPQPPQSPLPPLSDLPAPGSPRCIVCGRMTRPHCANPACTWVLCSTDQLTIDQRTGNRYRKHAGDKPPIPPKTYELGSGEGEGAAA